MGLDGMVMGCRVDLVGGPWWWQKVVFGGFRRFLFSAYHEAVAAQCPPTLNQTRIGGFRHSV